MADYTKTTNFASKDSLPSGDSGKIIKGTEFNVEFDAIATAIATKANLIGPTTFTGTTTLATVDINGGAIDGTTIGASSAAAGTFTNLTASGTVNFNGATVSNLGTITTANLDGGSIDGAVIGANTAAAGTFTALAASSATVGGAAVLTSVAFSDLNAGAVTTSGETFTDSDTQIPTNAAVKDHVEAVIPTLSVTEASVVAHQAALAIAASQLSDVTSTAAELNILDGVTSTTAELNILDGVTSTTAELNILDGVTSTTAELNILDGVTSTAAELNILDGVTSTTAELNILDGVTSTASELNILDGVTATTAELNYLDITTLGTTEASKSVTADANGVVTFDNGISEEYTAVTSSSNATTVNLRDGTHFSHTLSENTTFTFSNPASSGKVSGFTLKVVQDSSASGYTLTWPTSVDWPSATAPTLTATASAVDYFVFITHDGGTTYYGFTAGQALG